MAEEESPPKQTAKKKTTVKKAATKKSAPKKPASKKAPIKKTGGKGDSPAPTGDNTSTVKDPSAIPTEMDVIKSLIEEMRLENSNRDRQMSSLVKEINQGFSQFSAINNEKSSARDQELNRLHESLKDAFNNVEDSSKQSDERSLLILKALSESLRQDHEQTLKEVQEQKRLQDEKIEHLTKMEERRARRGRWLAAPGIIIAIIAIIYMFYVVNIMERAMTNMSGDMTKMEAAVSNMSLKMNGMAEDTHVMQNGMQDMNRLMGEMANNTSTITSDMDRLNQNLTNMGYNLGIMTRQVSPTMKGMRDMMPWTD